MNIHSTDWIENKNENEEKKMINHVRNERKYIQNEKQVNNNLKRMLRITIDEIFSSSFLLMRHNDFIVKRET